MSIPPPDTGFIQETLRAAVRSIVESYEDSAQPPDPGLTAPSVLAEAAERFLDGLHRLERGDHEPCSRSAEPVGDSQEMHTLGDYGFGLLRDLTVWAQALRLSSQVDALRRLTFALGLWLAQQGCELASPQPVVDTLAYVANQLKAPPDLERMYLAATQIMEAISPSVSQDFDDHGDPGRPWRILLLNRAIIATRSHQPMLMEHAFQTLVEQLPEDAPNFFREGMEQMDALGYPEQVRAVMERYYQLWCATSTLH